MPEDAVKSLDAEFEEIQADLEEIPQQATININTNTHLGNAPQRPYASVEDKLGRLTRGWRSMKALQAALPKGEKIFQREDGTWVREVSEHTGPTSAVRRGDKLFYKKRRVQRGVALTREQARASTNAVGNGGLEFDFFNGWCWERRGIKPEKDLAVSTAQPAEEDFEFEEASPADQAVFRMELARDAVLHPQATVADESAGRKGGK